MRVVGGVIKFIKLSDRDLISNAVERNGGFDTPVVDAANRLLNGTREGVVLDIGANIGTFSLPVARQNPQHKVVAFEPQRMVYYQLCGNIAINKLYNVDVLNSGLGSDRTQFSIDVPDYENEPNIGAFSLDKEVREHDDYLCKTKGVKQKVDVFTLDSYNFQDVRLIKIDVEGMELDVLKGGLATLIHNDYPPILFESWQGKAWFQPRRQALFKYLTDLGYNISTSGDENIAIHKKEHP
jgi:FkbM family methyltransferase